MHKLTLGTTSIRQLDGLYSLNDLHAASGGEKKHEPHQFMRNDQTQALIVELNSANSRSFQTIQGRNGGTYVCRELVIAYAAWISAAFHLKVIRVFLDVTATPRAKALPSPRDKLSKDLRSHINRQAHAVAMHQFDGAQRLLTDCALDNLACGATESSAMQAVEALASYADEMVLLNVRDAQELVWAVTDVLDAAGQAICAIRRIEARTQVKLVTRTKRKHFVDPDFHQCDRLVQEVLDRMSA